MISTIADGKITWIDLESPKEDEVASLVKQFGIDPIVAEELLRPTFHSKADGYDNLLYFVLHFPFFDETSQTSRSHEIDFVIGKDFLITVHYEKIEPFDNIIKEKKFENIKQSRHIFFNLLRELYLFSLRELSHVHKKIDEAEESIFNGEEKEMVGKLSFLRRDLLNFRRALKMHSGVFDSFENSAAAEFFGENFKRRVKETEMVYSRVWHIMENSKDTVESLQDTNNSLLANKTNEIMKVLTIMAFVTFPLSLIANIFGMNTQEIPIVGRVGDFWIIISIMSAATLAMFVFFKIKKWI